MDGLIAPIGVAKKSSDCHDQSTCHFDLGAQVIIKGVHFRLWAPKSARVEVVLNGGCQFARTAGEWVLVRDHTEPTIK
ncbi:MAG: hypothetical protein ABI955_01930 [Nitrospirota bacterium]